MRTILNSAIAALMLTACAGTSGTASPGPSDGSAPPVKGADADGILVIEEGAVASGPGITIDEAIGQAGRGPLLVNGSLLIDADGTIKLCSALAESFPPQCGGTRLLVRGLDPGSIPDLQEGNGVRWADAVQLTGTVSLVES